MEKNGRVKAVAAALAMLLVMLLGSMFGFSKLGVSCPLRTAVGVVRVVGLEKAHVTVRRSPRVVVARAGDALDALISFQALRGFTHLPDEQMDGGLLFSNGQTTELVSFSVNRWYSVWQWQE